MSQPRPVRPLVSTDSASILGRPLRARWRGAARPRSRALPPPRARPRRSDRRVPRQPARARCDHGSTARRRARAHRRRCPAARARRGPGRPGPFDGRPAVRAFPLQRASPLLRLHHLLAVAHRDAGELLAAAVNANVGAWTLSPVATEIEAQTIRWLCRAGRLPPRRQRPARERRQHGQHRRPAGGAGPTWPTGTCGRRAWRRPTRNASPSTARRRRTPGSRRPPT